MVDTWYTQYPFKKIKSALKKLKGADMETIKKKVKEIENQAIKSFKNKNVHIDFFLTDFYEYKHSNYVGLEKYVLNN